MVEKITGSADKRIIKLSLIDFFVGKIESVLEYFSREKDSRVLDMLKEISGDDSDEAERTRELITPIENGSFESKLEDLRNITKIINKLNICLAFFMSINGIVNPAKKCYNDWRRF